MMGIRGLRVLVTGGAGGIGRAVAERFAREGAHVALNDCEVNAAFAGNVAAMPSTPDGRHFIVAGDVSEEADAERIVGDAVAGLGGLDVLVNNAGIQIQQPSETLTLADFDRVMAVNVRGTFLCSRAAITHFLGTGRGGSIINTSSIHETVPKPHFLGYSASKGAIGNLTRTLALEFAGRNIRVNAVAPGATRTSLNPRLDDPTYRTEVERRIPIGRVASADEIAGAFVFLASSDAGYVTGATITVDGGLSLP